MKHADLSPSSAERWFACPGSIELSKDVAYVVSKPAVEGTLLHQISEMKLKDRLDGDGISLKSYWLGRVERVEDFEIEVDEEMINCAEDYVDYVQQTTKQKKGKLLIEEQVTLEEISIRCWGTADALILAKNHISVIDFKSGRYPVEVENNKQLKIYALGALARYGGEDTVLDLTIVQPRAKHKDGPVRTTTIKAQDLVLWGFNELKSACDSCEEENPKFNFGNHCRFCPAKDKCDTYNSFQNKE